MTAVTNTLERPDGRSRWERRRRTIIRELSAGHQHATPDRILIACIASASVRAEQLAERIVMERDVDDEELTRLTNVVARLVGQFSKSGHRKPAGPSLVDYLASRHGRTQTPGGTP